MHESTKRTAFGVTHPGAVRTHNEDAFLIDEALGLYVVCDGVSNEMAGEVASKKMCEMTLKALKHHRGHLEQHAKNPTLGNRTEAVDAVEFSIETAARQLFRISRSNPDYQGMATTIALLCVVGRSAIISHVGDSRVYICRNGEQHLLTLDHSATRARVRWGMLTKEQAESSERDGRLVRAIGAAEFVQADSLHVEVMAGDVFLLCSDGLYTYFQGNEFRDLCRDYPINRLPQKLIELAISRGGDDNITAVAVRIDHVSEKVDADEQASRKVEVLRRIPLFRTLTYQEIVKVLNIARVRVYKSGQQLIADGEENDEIFVTLSGNVTVKKNGKVLAELGPGSVVGEMSLINKPPRSADVTATDEAKAMVFRREDFDALLENEPALGIKLMRCLCNIVIERLRVASESLYDVKQMSPIEALARSQQAPAVRK